MVEKKVEFKGKSGKLYSAVIRMPEAEGKFPALIVCHGFMENKDRSLILDLASRLSYLRIITIRFDYFSKEGYGILENEQAPLTQQIEDIDEIINYLQQMPNVDLDRVILIGHDLGGNACILNQNKEVDGLIVLSMRIDAKRFIDSFLNDYEREEVRTRGKYENAGIRITKDFYDNLSKHDTLEAIKKKEIPILIIHGTNDKRCPVEEAKRIAFNSKKPTLEIIEEADHNFMEPEHREQIIETISNWISRNLRQMGSKR